MSATSRNLIVVGQGAAGLAAALSAAEEARGRGWPITITLIENAAADEAGGNTYGINPGGSRYGHLGRWIVGTRHGCPTAGA